ncbi:hypothetical protein ACGFZQ_06250 [Streptomyces sp. NPDC048254]|uniref:hypothetical protein n=1 Tax=Streptomyces sp. NPDC048254 TaxID=3365525 RepID=UPI003718D370
MTDTSRRRLLAGAAGLGGTALATTVATAAPAAAASGTGAGWLNVRDTVYGALGDDSTDDQPAIQKAIDAAAFQLNQVHCVDNDGHGFTFGDSAGTGGAPAGVAYVSGRTAGTSFTVKGAAGDTSTVAWLIVEPA